MNDNCGQDQFHFVSNNVYDESIFHAMLVKVEHFTNEKTIIYIILTCKSAI